MNLLEKSVAEYSVQLDWDCTPGAVMAGLLL